MSKIVILEKQARAAILRGVDFLADAVKVTEGPRGRNCLLGQRALGQSPKVTRDGVTVCNYVDPEDTVEQIGSDLIREAAQKTDNAVGDGTTASIVLAQAIIHEGFKEIEAGANPMAMERGIHKATEAIIKHVKEAAVSVDEDGVFRVATVSAHGDQEIGRLVADAIKKAGQDGVVTAEPSVTSDTFVQSVAGLELDKSNLLSPAFITHPEEIKAELTDCRILLWEGVISSAKSLVPVLTQVAKANQTMPLLICAGGYQEEAMACIINNKIKLGLPLIAIRLEAYGERRKELLRDLSALTGSPAYTEDLGISLERVDVSKLGQARKVVTDMRRTQIIEGRGNQSELAGRVEAIRKAIESAVNDEKAALKRRLAALLGGITIIKVGGTTVTEMEEKKDRVVDALSAARAAIEAGVVPGGGTALLRAAANVIVDLETGEESGAVALRQGCYSVTRQIVENAGLEGQKVVNLIMQNPADEIGFNAATGKYEDLVEAGIIDPVKVVTESLRNAAAVACSILTMGAVVAEKRTERING